MKKITFLLSLLLVLAFSLVALAADPAAVAVPVPVAPAPSFLTWCQANLAYILGVALSVSELLGVTPWFKGNGVLDSIVKSLKFLASKTETGQ